MDKNCMDAVNNYRLDEMNRSTRSIALRLLGERRLPASSDDKSGGLLFTGWKPRHDLLEGGSTIFWEEGLVGQWLDWRNRDKLAYMAVPSFTGGLYAVGDRLNCGAERVTLGQTEGIEQILLEGLERLINGKTKAHPPAGHRQ